MGTQIRYMGGSWRSTGHGRRTNDRGLKLWWTTALTLLPTFGIDEAARAESFTTHPFTPITAAQLDLHNIMLWILSPIFIFVQVLIIYAVINFRHKPGRQASQAEHHYNLEIAWTVIPTLILCAMAYPTYNTFAKMRSFPEKPDLTIEIIGHKWFWEYRYPDHGIQIVDSDPVNSPKSLVVPVNKVVNLNITSVDVIHSWWMPALGIKQDATPGHIRQAWFNVSMPATYTGQCAELCGTLHGKMWIHVEAMEDKYFDQWLKSQPRTQLEPLPRYQPGVIPAAAPSPAVVAAASPGAPVNVGDLKAKGEKIYGKACVACHQVTGQGLAGAFPPLVGSEWVLGDKEKHISVILKGLSGSIMVKGQSFNGVMPAGGNIKPNVAEITDEEVAAVITYERNAWGNKADAVTPDDVKAARAKLQ